MVETTKIGQNVTDQEVQDFLNAQRKNSPIFSTSGSFSNANAITNGASLPYGAATIVSATPPAGDSKPSASTDFNKTSNGDNQSALEFWSGQPGFEQAYTLLDPKNPTDEDELYTNKLFVEQAQEFLKYREGLYKNGQEDLSQASVSTQKLLKPFEQLTNEEKKELVSEATWGAGWISNNTGGTMHAWSKLTSDDLPAKMQQAALFMMDATDNLSFADNMWDKTKRFAVQGVLADPISIGSIILGAFSFGAGTAAVQGASIAAKEAGKATLREIVKTAATQSIQETAKAATKKVVEAASSQTLKATVVKGAAIGAADASASNSLEQNIKTSEFQNNNDQTVQRQNNFSWSELGASTAIGATFGGGLSAAGHYSAKFWSEHDVSAKFKNLFNREAKQSAKVKPSASTSFGRTHVPQTDSKLDIAKIKEDLSDANLEKITPILDILENPKNADDVQELARQLNNRDDIDPYEILEQPTLKSEEELKTEIEFEEQLAKDLGVEPKEIDRYHRKIEKTEQAIQIELAEKNNDILHKFFTKHAPAKFQDIPQPLKDHLLDTDKFIRPLQEFAFGRQVDTAIKSRSSEFDLQTTLSKYSTLSENEPSLKSKQKQYDSFVRNFDNLQNGVDRYYNELLNKINNNKEITNADKKFVDQYRSTFKIEQKDYNQPFTAPRTNDGQPKTDKNDYANLTNTYIAARSSNGAPIPKYDTNLSWKTVGFYALIQNHKNMKLSDAYRFNPIKPEGVPVDGFSSINNVVSSIDKIFNSKYSNSTFNDKITQLQANIKGISNKANGRITISQAKDYIGKELESFANENREHLQKMSEEIAIIQHVIKDWEAKGKTGANRAGWKKAITQEQKEALIKYTNDMQNIITQLQDTKFGSEGAHLNTLQTTDELKNFLSRITQHTEMSFMRIHDKIQEPGKALEELQTAQIQVRDNVARGIELGYYSNQRRTTMNPNNQDNNAIAIDPGNAESLLDKSIVALANGVSTQDSWNVTQRGQMASVIAPLIKNNMTAEALYNIREMRWRLDNLPGDKWQADWIKDLRDQLGDSLNDPYVKEAYELVAHKSSPELRGGGGKPGPFGIQSVFLDGVGGARWYEEQYINATFQPRLSQRMKGGERLTLSSFNPFNPSFGIAKLSLYAFKERYIKAPTEAAKGHLSGKLLVKNKETGEWEYKGHNELAGQNPNDIEIKGLLAKGITKIPLLKNYYGTNAFAQYGIRAPIRAFFAAETAALTMVKNTYGMVGNTGIMLGAGMGVAGAADLIVSEIENTDDLGILSKGIEIATIPIDVAVWAASKGSEAKRSILLDSWGIEKDSALNYVLTADGLVWAWDSGSNLVQNEIENSLSSRGEFSLYKNLRNFIKPDDIQDRFRNFSLFMDQIDDEIASAPPSNSGLFSPVKQQLVTLKESNARIVTRYNSLIEARPIVAGELQVAKANYEKELERSQLFLSPQERSEHEETLHQLKVLKSGKENELSKLEEKVKSFAINLERIVYSTQKIKSYYDEINAIERENELATADEAKQNEADLARIKSNVASHLKYRSASLEYLVGKERLQELENNTSATNTNADATNTNADATNTNTGATNTNAGATNTNAGATNTSTRTTTNTTIPTTITSPFKSSAQQPQPKQQTRTAPTQTTSQTTTQQLKSAGDTLNQYVGFDLTGMASDTASSGSSFFGQTWDFLKHTDNKWVGIIGAGLAGLLAVNMINSKPNPQAGFFSNMFGTFGRLATFAIAGLAVWGGWRALKSDSSAENAQTSSQTTMPSYNNNVVPFVGQGGNHAPVNDSSAYNISRTTVGHNGANMRQQTPANLYAHNGNGAFVARGFVANNVDYTTNIDTVPNSNDIQTNPLTSRADLGNGFYTQSITPKVA